jgi:hypothetical protein
LPSTLLKDLLHLGGLPTISFDVFAKLSSYDEAGAVDRYMAPFKKDRSKQERFEQYLDLCCHNDRTFLQPLTDFLTRYNQEVLEFHKVVQAAHAGRKKHEKASDVPRRYNTVEELEEATPFDNTHIVVNARPPARKGESVRQSSLSKPFASDLLRHCAVVIDDN